MHCGPQDARGSQCTAGLRGCDKRGTFHPGLRGWDNRNPRPVYGRLPFCRGATEALIAATASRLIGRAFSPWDAEVTAA